MLTHYRARQSKSEDSKSSNSEKFIPAGTLSVTKRNGRLLLTRSKQPRNVDIANNLIGQAFGGRVKIIRKRAQSVERLSEKTPLLIAGVPFIPQLRSQSTAPLRQPGFAPPIPMTPLCQGWQTIPQYAQYSHHPYNQIPANPCFNPNPSVGPGLHFPTTTVFPPMIKDIDAHFHKASMDNIRVSADGDDTNKTDSSKPKIPITKHVCAHCGVLRSRKFHREHPIKQGDEPEPTFCRNCQRDDSSPDESECEREDWKSRVEKKSKRFHHNLQSAVEDISGSELSLVPKPQRGPKSVLKKTTRDRMRYEDGFIVGEEYPEDEERRRGRSRQRKDVQRHYPTDESYLADICSSSSSREEPEKLSSDNRRGSYNTTRQHQNPQRRRVHLNSGQDSTDSRQSSVSLQDRRVPPPREQTPVETYPKKIPIHFVDEEVIPKLVPKSKSPTVHSEESELRNTRHEDVRQEHRKLSVSSLRRERDYQYSISPKRDRAERASHDGSDQLGKNDNLDSMYLTPSQVSVARRRRERRANPPAPAESWKTAQTIDPESTDEPVVNERYECRPGKTANSDEEAQRRRAYLAKEMLSIEKEKSRLAAREAAARYYSDDWSREEMLAKRKEQSEAHYAGNWSREKSASETEHFKRDFAWPGISGWGKKRQPGSWRRDVWNDSELCSEANDRHAVKESGNAQSAASLHGWRLKVPSPTDSDVPTTHNAQRGRRERGGGYRRSSEDTVVRRPHRASKPRPAYVRGSSDEEKALIPSPRSSSSTSLVLSPHVSFGQDKIHYFEDGDYDESAEYEVEEATSDFGSSVSRITDAETELTSRIEKIVKKVMFRDDMSQRSVTDGKSERFYSSDYDTESGSGGENADSGKGDEWVSGGGDGDGGGGWDNDTNWERGGHSEW